MFLPLIVATVAAASHYQQGMALWRDGKAAEALPQLMTALLDPDESFYASKQVALMGRYALPLLYRGLWHEEQAVERQSAVILGWIADPEALEPLLMRISYPDAPIEIEYAIRKIGGVTSQKLLSLLEQNDLRNPALLDHKVTSVLRLARASGLPLDPAPLLALVRTIERELRATLETEPHGHAANARLSLLLFLAERKVQAAAAPLVAALDPGAPEPNLEIAGALVDLGPSAAGALSAAFREPRYAALKPLLAVTHFLASGGAEASWAGPASAWLNEVRDDRLRLRETAAVTAWLSREPNPLLLWFQHHDDRDVRKALAPLELEAGVLKKRPGLLAFFLEKTRDPDGDVAAAHLAVASSFLPDGAVESRLSELLSSRDQPAELRRAALEVFASHGRMDRLLPLVRDPSEPLREAAVDSVARHPEPPVVSAVLGLLTEPEPSNAKRQAIWVTTSLWQRSEAKAPLLSLLRSGDPLWLEAARGLAALGASEGVEPFLGWVEAGRLTNREQAASIYFSFTGIPARLAGESPGSFRFEPLPLEPKPPGDELLVLYKERTDFTGWIKVEETWTGKRLFRIDEGKEELKVYDRALFEAIGSGSILCLEQTTSQSVLGPLELTEARAQKARVVPSLPEGELAGLTGEAVVMLVDGDLRTLPLGKEVRLDGARESSWGSAALVPFRFWSRDKVKFDPAPPPSGWLRGQSQPMP